MLLSVLLPGEAASPLRQHHGPLETARCSSSVIRLPCAPADYHEPSLQAWKAPQGCRPRSGREAGACWCTCQGSIGWCGPFIHAVSSVSSSVKWRVVHAMADAAVHAYPTGCAPACGGRREGPEAALCQEQADAEGHSLPLSRAKD